MSGRRASQKAWRRGEMLAAAARLFEKQGYAATTFDEIAAEAGVGVATVYKYFNSKQGIVIALLEPDLRHMLARAQRLVERPHSDPAKSMMALLSAYRNLGGRNWASRELLRLTVYPGMGNDGLLTELVQEAESKTQAQIRELLKNQRAAGRLKPRLPLADATAVVFALLNQHFAMYLSDPGLHFTQISRRLARCVRLVFVDWRH
ncbi:MAG: TetR/AcrR family transcriptional regulator [Gammaproteobacteria bacterium]